MTLNRTYLTDIAGLIIYMTLAWLSLNFFSISEYDWMLDDGSVADVCGLPYDPDRGIFAPCGLLIVIPLLFITCRAFLQKKRFRMLIYSMGAIILLLRWWWLFSGIYLQCPVI
ncbi:TPA: DUF2645 family protein [Morganella morganii]|nr:DUF2645 family protein [Morganella morganii]